MGEAALLRACREMAAAHAREQWEDAEIVGTPAEYWLGSRRIAAATVQLGLLLVLFRSEGLGTSYERHTLNERGLAYAEKGE